VVARVAVGGCLVTEQVAPRLASGCGSHELQQQQAWVRERERRRRLIFVGFTWPKMIHSYLAEFLCTKSKLKPMVIRHI